MSALVEAIEHVIAPYLDQPFAFYGHSMGAAVAFELARALQRHGRPLPSTLYVSGARSPKFRLNWTPPPAPSEAELLEQLRELDGIPTDILDNPQAMEIAMRILRADSALYRTYVYSPEEALAVPIFAYGGAADPNVRAEHVEAWREQTTSRSVRREFEGGHFFIRSSRDAFLRALREDLSGAT